METALEFITQQRERLNAKRAEITVQLDTVTAHITIIDRELAALDVYESALQGKRDTTTNRIPRGETTLAILKTVKNHPGSTAAELKNILGAESAAAKRTITNLLSTLKQAGKITHTDGRYTVAEA